MVFLPHWPKSIQSKNLSPKDSLTRISHALSRIGNPDKKLPGLIHVSGTNGKGSTIAFLRSILLSLGYKVNSYTSPHIHHFNERISFSSGIIDERQLYQITDEVRVLCQDLELTFFEATTCIALLAFYKNKSDITLIETGIGGEFDATNIINNKLATIITSISKDHEEYLGYTLSSIATHKALIMRPGVNCILAPQKIDVENQITAISQEIGSKLIKYHQHYSITKTNNTIIFTYGKEKYNFSLPQLLIGDHQLINLASCLAAIKSSNLRFNQELINEGIKNANIHSRLTHIESGFLVNLLHKYSHIDSKLYIDGAHNIAGADILSKWIDKQDCATYLITAFTKGKAKVEFFNKFIKIVDFIAAIRCQEEPNSESEEVVQEAINKTNIKSSTFENLQDAIYYISNLKQDQKCKIIICGSFYLARDLKKYNS
jgi:dihydrofolate synthase/folylpolyglutamate synthase